MRIEHAPSCLLNHRIFMGISNNLIESMQNGGALLLIKSVFVRTMIVKHPSQNTHRIAFELVEFGSFECTGSERFSSPLFIPAKHFEQIESPSARCVVLSHMGMEVTRPPAR